MLKNQNILKYFLSIILLLLICFSLKTQNLYNIKNQYKNASSDSARVMALLRLADEYRHINQDSSKYFLNKAYYNAKLTESEGLISYVDVRRAVELAYSFKIDSAFNKANNSLLYFLSIDDKRGIMMAKSALGFIYTSRGNYDRGFYYCYSALELAEELDETRQIAVLNNNIAYIHIVNGNYDSAISFLMKVSTNKDKNVSDIRAMSFLNLGIVYLVIDEYDLALDNFLLAEKIAVENYYKNILQLVYVNSAHLYLKNQEFDNAFKNYKLAIKYQTLLNQFRPLADSYKGLGDTFFAKNNNALAKKYYSISDSIANKYDFWDIISNINFSMAQVYLEEGNYKEAYNNIYNYAIIKDSLNNINYKMQIALIESEHHIEKIQSENKILQLNEKINLEKIVRQRNTILFLAITITLFLILYFYSLVQKRLKTTAYKKLLNMNLEQMADEDNIPYSSNLKNEDSGLNLGKYQKSTLSDEQKDILLKKFKHLFTNEQVYLNSNLTLDEVAEKLNVYKNHLSQVVNERLNENFITHVNKHRIKEARRLLIDEQYANQTIESIGYQVGFNSKTSFNNAFKKFTGITPSFFRENTLINK